MSVVYCFTCQKPVDTDYYPEHFDENLECVIDEVEKEKE